MGSAYSYRVQKKKSRSLIYLILAVVFAFAMFKWGLPFFVDILAGPEKDSRSSQNEDKLPPQTPILSALPEATNSANIVIEGYTEGGAEVAVLLNDKQAASAQTKDDGSFSLELKLIEGENTILVKARDKAGNESVSSAKTVVYDISQVEITLESPLDGAEFFGKQNQTITLVGKVNKPDADLFVNGSFVRVRSDGNFSYSVRLSEGENTLTIRAIGKAGNVAEKTVKLKLIL